MSEKYIVSARKYRPATFATVVGQKNLTETLKGAIAGGRLAHAYLFCGPRGVGKTSCARIFARTINCLNPRPDGEACGECESCRSIERGNSFNLVELDAASNNSVEDIRTITEQVAIPPQVGKYRVFIIDEVHMLTPSAFNAFLKTLEEPPAYAVFILATTEKHKVIPTILSRCQIYDFKRITINDIIDHLEYVAQSEGITADRRALGVIARKADGAMRDALSIFDQVAAACGGDITYEKTVENLNVLDYEYFFKLVDTFAKGDAAEALLLYKDVRDRGFDSLFFVNSLAQHIRDLMVAVDKRTLPLLEVADDVSQRLAEQAGTLPLKWYFAAMKLLNDCDLNYRTATNKQLLVELTLIRLTQLLTPAQPPFDISDRPVALRDITEQLRATSSTAHVAAPTPMPAPDPTPSAPGPSVAQPAVQPLRPAMRPAKRPGDNRPRSFSLRQAARESVQSHVQRNAPFSYEELVKAWSKIAVVKSDHMMLVTAVRAALPQQVGSYSFKVLAKSHPDLQALEKDLLVVTQFLRDELNNDNITLSVELDPNIEHFKPLPPHEFLAQAVAGNPALAKLLKEIDAEIL